MRQHAVLSPSKAKRWMTCPGSWVLENAFKDEDGSSQYAEEGTRLHGYVERALRASPDSNVLDEALGAESQDTQGAVEFCVDFARNLQKEFPGGSLIETEVSIEDWTKEAGAKGSVDFAHYTDTDLWVVDWKFGQGVRVDAERNPQAVLYGLGILSLVNTFAAVRNIHLVIVQPLLDHVTEWDISVDELKRQGRIIKQKASICRMQRLLPKDELTLVPREDVCQFCKAKASCPALAEIAGSALDRAEGMLTASELGYWLDRLPSLKQFTKAIEDEGMKRLLAGDPVTGWKLVAGGRGKRSWTDDTQAEKALVEAIGDRAIVKSVISPTQAEKLTKAKKGETPVMPLQQWALIEPLVKYPEAKPTLAHADDPRDPWIEKTANASDFDEVKTA